MCEEVCGMRRRFSEPWKPWLWWETRGEETEGWGSRVQGEAA